MADWTPEEMGKPEMLRRTWVLDGNKAALVAALSSTCSASAAARLISQLRASLRVSNDQHDRGAAMIDVYVRFLSEYPAIIAAEQVYYSCRYDTWFPGAWSDLGDRLDAVKRELEALAK